MLHRFLLRGCRRGHMPRSFSLLGFNFGVNFRCFGERSVWHFICTWAGSSSQEREKGWGWVSEGRDFPSSRSVYAHCPLKLQVMMLGCLSICLSVPGFLVPSPSSPCFSLSLCLSCAFCFRVALAILLIAIAIVCCVFLALFPSPPSLSLSLSCSCFKQLQSKIHH